MMTVFDDYDFCSNQDDLIVYTNEQLLSEYEDLAIFSKHFTGKKTPKMLLKALSLVYLDMYAYD